MSVQRFQVCVVVIQSAQTLVVATLVHVRMVTGAMESTVKKVQFFPHKRQQATSKF